MHISPPLESHPTKKYVTQNKSKSFYVLKSYVVKRNDHPYNYTIQYETNIEMTRLREEKIENQRR